MRRWERRDGADRLKADAEAFGSGAETAAAQAIASDKFPEVRNKPESLKPASDKFDGGHPETERPP
ncbi:hypothetical protein [Afipia felis]